jgi:plasmid stability protein
MPTLRIKNFPDRLYAALLERAAEEQRSLAQQVVHMLQAALAPPNTRSILELRGLGREVWRGIDANKHVRDERRTWEPTPTNR